ncbi:uncharacterized protein [Equus przewalskii]|uniref:Uncharacterized protein isoform X2 n=1 Tax=Equus przewalskii TaxID=9798 RepID=A0ABM4P465_EQUPR
MLPEQTGRRLPSALPSLSPHPANPDVWEGKSPRWSHVAERPMPLPNLATMVTPRPARHSPSQLEKERKRRGKLPPDRMACRRRYLYPKESPRSGRPPSENQQILLPEFGRGQNVLLVGGQLGRLWMVETLGQRAGDTAPLTQSPQEEG